MSDEFPFAYGGAKGTYGFSSGKVFYEVKFVKAIDVRADFGDLEFKHILRAGWSDLLTDLQLGNFIYILFTGLCFALYICYYQLTLPIA